MALSVMTSQQAWSERVRPLDFTLPRRLEAAEPPEARGLRRDQVRLMVSSVATDELDHTTFRHLPEFLDPGDVIVINTSGTMNASLPVVRQDGSAAELHLSTHQPDGRWSVELRVPDGKATKRAMVQTGGEDLSLPAGGRANLSAPYRSSCAHALGEPRLWLAELSLPEDTMAYLARHGSPIRYSYVPRRWPASYYQTVYATDIGSAEMPSAGRGFSPELMAELVAKGVRIAPLLLHTGVASLESHEPPYEEFYRVPAQTANVVNLTRSERHRVIAVGTTVVRALESVADAEGWVHAGEGWTCLTVTPERGVHAVDGLLTGLHEPRSSHLAMLEAIAGLEHVRLTYREALTHDYLWHEFGDLHLILP